MKRMGLFLLVVAALLLSAGPVLAQDETPPVVQPLQTTLDLLAQGIGVGFVIAFLAEKVKAFQALQPGQKSAVILGVSVGLPVVARLALQFIPPNVWSVVEPYWQSVAIGFLGWAGSQLAYQRVVKPATQARKGLE